MYDTNTVRELESVANDFIYSIAYIRVPEPSRLVYVTTQYARIISFGVPSRSITLFINYFFSVVS